MLGANISDIGAIFDNLSPKNQEFLFTLAQVAIIAEQSARGGVLQQPPAPKPTAVSKLPKPQDPPETA